MRFLSIQIRQVIVSVAHPLLSTCSNGRCMRHSPLSVSAGPRDGGSCCPAAVTERKWPAEARAWRRSGTRGSSGSTARRAGSSPRRWGCRVRNASASAAGLLTRSEAVCFVQKPAGAEMEMELTGSPGDTPRRPSPERGGQSGERRKGAPEAG